MSALTGEKGLVAEEALRNYFRSVGYFVVRGIKLGYKGSDITDVDLWLYLRATSLIAERTCVDVKNTRNPRAMERVLWTRGLKEILRIDHAVVVTTDNRPETRDFGAAYGITILQGNFLRRVITNFSPSGYLAEEELFSLLAMPCITNPRLDWQSWYRQLKATLLSNLDFDGCNMFLAAIDLLLAEYQVNNNPSDALVRLLYVVVSFFLVSLDYASHLSRHIDLPERTAALIDGFRYGEAGRQRTDEIVGMALQLLSDVGRNDPFADQALRGEFGRQISARRADLLGKYFARPDALKNLFSLARSFEELAYSRATVHPRQTPVEQKAIVGLLCDFLGHDRKALI